MVDDEQDPQPTPAGRPAPGEPPTAPHPPPVAARSRRALHRCGAGTADDAERRPGARRLSAPRRDGLHLRLLDRVGLDHPDPRDLQLLRLLPVGPPHARPQRAPGRALRRLVGFRLGGSRPAWATGRADAVVPTGRCAHGRAAPHDPGLSGPCHLRGAGRRGPGHRRVHRLRAPRPRPRQARPVGGRRGVRVVVDLRALGPSRDRARPGPREGTEQLRRPDRGHGLYVGHLPLLVVLRPDDRPEPPLPGQLGPGRLLGNGGARAPLAGERPRTANAVDVQGLAPLGMAALWAKLGQNATLRWLYRDSGPRIRSLVTLRGGSCRRSGGSR